VGAGRPSKGEGDGGGGHLCKGGVRASSLSMNSSSYVKV
jgi:hypothetical protein